MCKGEDLTSAIYITGQWPKRQDVGSGLRLEGSGTLIFVSPHLDPTSNRIRITDTDCLLKLSTRNLLKLGSGSSEFWKPDPDTDLIILYLWTSESPNLSPFFPSRHMEKNTCITCVQAQKYGLLKPSRIDLVQDQLDDFVRGDVRGLARRQLVPQTNLRQGDNLTFTAHQLSFLCNKTIQLIVDIRS